MYHLEIKHKAVFRWVCESKKSKLCSSRCNTVVDDSGGHKIIKMSDHSHDPLAYKKSVFIANDEIKKAGVTSGLKPSQIVRQSILHCDPDCRVYLPTKDAQRQKIKRVRTIEKIDKEPTNVAEINIPNNIKYLEGEQFVLAEKSFNNNDKIVILGSRYSLQLLSEAKCWLMDGTFQVAPLFMRQLFAIHGKVGSEIVPLVFCIMSSKSEEAYKEFFYELCLLSVNFRINLEPDRIISDFEKASVKAARQFIPSAEYKGCFFHFGKIIWRQIQQKGMASMYGNSEKLSTNMKMLKALAFVPVNELDAYFNDLYETFNSKEKEIGKWMKKNYIGSERRQPSYKPNFWSVADSAKFPRTQNSVEAYHRRLQIVSGKIHLGLYELIEELGKESIVVKTNIEKMKSGTQKTVKSSIIEKSNRIKRVINARTEMTKLDYLKNIAINLSLC